MRIIIVGNSGAARECYWLLRQAHDADASTPPFKGFLAWKGYAGQLCELAALALGDSDAYKPSEEDAFVIGIGRPALRLAVYAWVRGFGGRFYTLRHPNAYVCPSASLGEGNIFQRSCTVQANARLGNANFFNGGVIIGHDTHVGDGNTFNLRTGISGNVTIGDANQFGPMCTVLEKASIGDGNVFAPGAVVYRGCRNHCLMAGNPALVEKRHLDRTGGGYSHA